MSTDSTPTYVGLARLYWMFIGPMTSALICFRIVTHPSGPFTLTDVAFFLSIGGLMLARWAEFRSGAPQTAEGEPAAPEHLRRYCLAVPCVGAIAWIVAKIVGGFLVES